MQTPWIKSVSCEYRCDDEYFEEFNKGKILKYSLILVVLPQNRLDPIIFGFITSRTIFDTFTAS